MSNDSVSSAKIPDKTSQETSLSCSYVPAYCLIGSSMGFALSYATDRPIFLPICLCASAGFGMIRNNNIKNDDGKKSDMDRYLSYGIKAVALYYLGPTLLVSGLIGILAIAAK